MAQPFEGKFLIKERQGELNQTYIIGILSEAFLIVGALFVGLGTNVFYQCSHSLCPAGEPQEVLNALYVGLALLFASGIGFGAFILFWKRHMPPKEAVA